jgi:Putative transposase
MADITFFAAFLRPWATADWVVYAKQPFGGPEHVLRYLSRYTHRVAISNRRLIAADENGVTFRYKDYRIEGPGRYTTKTLHTHEFIRRFLMHVLPKGLHRIRHYGFLANGTRAENIAKVRELLSVAPPVKQPENSQAPATDQACALPHPCPCCGGRMFIIEFFEPGCEPKHRPSSRPPVVRIDTS